MKVNNYQDGVIDIEISKSDLENINAIIDQINIINQDLIQLGIPYDHPKLTHERVVDLKQKLREVQDVNKENVIIKLNQMTVTDLNAILIGASAIDDPFVFKNGGAIDEKAIEQLETEVSLIWNGFKTEEEIKFIEQEQKIVIPRFK